MEPEQGTHEVRIGSAQNATCMPKIAHDLGEQRSALRDKIAGG